MATCGYLCPLCSNTGYTDENLSCTWCQPISKTISQSKSRAENISALSQEDWIEQVHCGPCCSDLNSK